LQPFVPEEKLPNYYDHRPGGWDMSLRLYSQNLSLTDRDHHNLHIRLVGILIIV